MQRLFGQAKAVWHAAALLRERKSGGQSAEHLAGSTGSEVLPKITEQVWSITQVFNVYTTRSAWSLIHLCYVGVSNQG